MSVKTQHSNFYFTSLTSGLECGTFYLRHITGGGGGGVRGGVRGGVVIETLCYKQEGRGFDSR
jgi:hypothetical protein